ncbi:hypothetical protein [Kribbella italica]|uniref:Uncharacterized protein n=1 Tax=Kribbella italica TaxID=1540520 RepID=A0A7W9J6H2_9ACTN|nr:hypothetical protein [Kribbella italica]MBB5836486.1 hypothetical protein [Kribbella italica]
MPVDIEEFTLAFNRARDRVRGVADADVAAEQARLRALVPSDASADERRWTGELIDSLAVPSPPAKEWSELYHEAGRIHESAYPVQGTVAEQIAALEAARRKIWQIADRAGEDEAPHIRAMTRVLEHLEEELRNPTWPA